MLYAVIYRNGTIPFAEDTEAQSNDKSNYFKQKTGLGIGASMFPSTGQLQFFLPIIKGRGSTIAPFSLTVSKT